MRRSRRVSYNHMARYKVNVRLLWIKAGYSIESAEKSFGVDWIKNPIVRIRAAKRFNRLRRAGKIKD